MAFFLRELFLDPSIKEEGYMGIFSVSLDTTSLNEKSIYNNEKGHLQHVLA